MMLDQVKKKKSPTSWKKHKSQLFLLFLKCESKYFKKKFYSIQCPSCEFLLKCKWILDTWGFYWQYTIKLSSWLGRWIKPTILLHLSCRLMHHAAGRWLPKKLYIKHIWQLVANTLSKGVAHFVTQNKQHKKQKMLYLVDSLFIYLFIYDNVSWQ